MAYDVTPVTSFRENSISSRRDQHVGCKMDGVPPVFGKTRRGIYIRFPRDGTTTSCKEEISPRDDVKRRCSTCSSSGAGSQTASERQDSCRYCVRRRGGDRCNFIRSFFIFLFPFVTPHFLCYRCCSAGPRPPMNKKK